MNVWVQGGTGVIQDSAFVQEWWTALNKHRKKLLQHIADFLHSFVCSVCIIKSLAKKPKNTEITKAITLQNP